MQRRLLDRLACPDCKAPLLLEDEGPDGGGAEGGAVLAGGADEVVNGMLRCSGCGFGYPIEAGIPNLLPQAFHRDEVQD